MLYFLENLLKLPKVGIQNVIQEGEDIFLILECTEEKVKCKNCEILTDELHQKRYVMVRDLPLSGQSVYLKVPRRKFYYKQGINNRLKLIKRQAYGFLNFDNMRRRFLACFST